MKLTQINNCLSWITDDYLYQIDYWANANRPRKKNGAGGGYGMYTLMRLAEYQIIGQFTNRKAAVAAILKDKEETK